MKPSPLAITRAEYLLDEGERAHVALSEAYAIDVKPLVEALEKAIRVIPELARTPGIAARNDLSYALLASIHAALAQSQGEWVMEAAAMMFAYFAGIALVIVAIGWAVSR